ncbi:hypothetical protein G6011_07570 [Alternaria panax]|uniref:NACHT domain-containing protein n=1 Tax=Alternaria panax TaxID=48097 RepID=A0AAD4I4U6_9PLEO|nr:hypothetical protein G6011_07570 [Alternaria panax]
MATTSSAQGGSFRRGLSVRMGRFRRKFHHHSDETGTLSRHRPSGGQQIIGDLRTSNQVSDASQKLIALETHDHTPLEQTSLHAGLPHHETTNGSAPGDGVVNTTNYTDLWSAAYREAVDSLGNDIDVAILKGSSAAQLLEKLEDVGKESNQESVFLRGITYLRSIQVPLERFKLALDLASPLGNLDPTASTVLGVVRSVTAIAISCATADLEFAKQIGEMLEQISYIDDCDTLGQRANKTDIHKALVSVYREILEFYIAAHEILTERGRKLAMKMILETDRLPNIVRSFLEQAEKLRKLIEKATWEIVEDIKTMLYDREIARWLNSGRMTVQSQYHALLQDLRTDEACEFLLTHPNFIKWYHASDTQQLVLFGEMGSGKTVAVAYLVDELNRRDEHQLPRPKVCYYYCRDDDTGQAINILSTLILALLEQLSGLKRTFYNWYKEKQACGVLEPATNPRMLEEFLESILITLDRLLFIVIDGLDECDSTSRNTLLKYLKRLSTKTPRLRIFLSSRPEEEILRQLSQVPRIDMKSDADRDSVIVRHTVEGRLSHLSTDVRKLVTDTLSRRAKGSAIWSKMAIELIEVRKISAPGPMRRFLEEMPLPGQLSSLYDKLLLRNSSDDIENQELATMALKLLAVACRPLSIQELAWAVALAATRAKVNTVAALSELVDHQRITGLIHPFINRIDFTDTKKRQVQFVHQSVREYIIQKCSHIQGSVTSITPDPYETHEKSNDMEAFMLGVCIDYLMLDEIGSIPLFSEEQLAIDELPQDFDLFNDSEPFEYDRHCTWEAWEEDMICYDPTERGFGEFFVYASSFWLKHLGAIESRPFPPPAKIEILCQAGSRRLDNWINQNCRPGCAIKARFEFYSYLYDPLSITALFGSDQLLRDLLETSTFDNDKYLVLPAISAADQIMQWGDLAKLKILLLEGQLCHQLRNLDFFRLIIRQWFNIRTRHEDWEPAFSLVDYVLDTMVEEQWGHELLCIAARYGCIPMVRRLLSQAQRKVELKAELLRAFEWLGSEVRENHLDAVECVIREEGFEEHLHHLNNGRATQNNQISFPQHG